MRTFLLSLLLIFSVGIVPTSSFARQSFNEIWDGCMPIMSKGMELVAQGVDTEKRSLGEILTRRDPKFQRLLKECFEILADSETMDLLAQRDKMQKSIHKKQREIVEMQKEMISAPSEHWNPLKATKTSLKKGIENRKKEIAQLQTDLQLAKEHAVQVISSRGVPVSAEQVDALLSAADGEDTASIMAVAENIKGIQGKIEEVVQSPESSVELLKTYTGIYMMCNKVYVYAIQHALERIHTVYLQKLAKLRAEATDLLKSARKMLAEANPTDRRILETNIASNQRTLEVIGLYTQYLQRQQRLLEQLHKKAEKTANVAVNTYKTVKTSTELLRMMRTTSDEFAQIFRFEPPSVSLLYDERLRGEFEAITAQLRLND